MTKYQIPMNEASDEFTVCWQAARRHLLNQVDMGSLKFIRSRLTPPIQEHLSFIIGNQLFFVHVRDVFSNMSPIRFPEVLHEDRGKMGELRDSDYKEYFWVALLSGNKGNVYTLVISLF